MFLRRPQIKVIINDKTIAKNAPLDRVAIKQKKKGVAEINSQK
jgi:hypothetical protein